MAISCQRSYNKFLIQTFQKLLLNLLIFLIVPMNINTTAITNPSLNTVNLEENYGCPQYCSCVLAHHKNMPFLHAKCTSLQGLKMADVINTTVPVHSIDLSYLNLTKLSHTLSKLHDLTSIDLSYNGLHEIGHFGRRIRKLNLKNNRLTSDKLKNLPHYVQTLNLQYNDITYLPKEFMHLSELQFLELGHNRINCSCETLEVRNWLQNQHVYMAQPVVCHQPVEAKGKPWLQVRQSEICAKELLSESLLAENDNELMMGDQAFDGSGEEQDEDELGKAFLPIEKNLIAKKSVKMEMFDSIEGSGHMEEAHFTTDSSANDIQREYRNPAAKKFAKDTNEEEVENDDESSGSGGAYLVIPFFHDEKPEDTLDTFNNGGLGIFEDSSEHDESNSSLDAVSEETIVPVTTAHLEKETVAEDTESPESADYVSADSITHAKPAVEDNNATYLLLGVIALIIIGLLAYVAIKRCNRKRRNPRDVENPPTELIDMSKRQLGKPLGNGVSEHVPLIEDTIKPSIAKTVNGSNKKPYDKNDLKVSPSVQREPLLHGNGIGNGRSTAPHEDDQASLNRPAEVPSEAPHEYYPISPRYPPPKSPRAMKSPTRQREPNNNVPQHTSTDTSPNAGRYSPVYSPETGRVKIKLTETPKPKTPMLVTRSRSNAGDIITTPIQAALQQNTATPIAAAKDPSAAQ